MKTQKIVIAIALVIIAVALRLLPHPANFAPVAAVAIFGGATLPRRLAIWVPLVAMMLSDAVIGFHNLILVTWGCYALIALAANIALKKPSIAKGAVVTLSGSVFFFLATNFAVWVWGNMYPHTTAGLANCFYMALPFFRNTLASDVFYTASLFSVYALAIKYSPKLFGARQESS